MTIPNKELIGSWSDEDIIYTFEHNTFSEIDADDLEVLNSGNYQIIEDQLILKSDGDNEKFHFKIKKNKLTLTDEDGDKEKFKRIDTLQKSSSVKKTNKEFSGSYLGSIQNNNALAELVQSGDKIEGKIDVSGYIYRLNGDIKVKNTEGSLTDVQNNATIPFTASLQKGNLILTIDMPNPQTGAASAVTFLFKPYDGKDITVNKINNNESHQNIDKAIIGIWRKTDSFSDPSIGGMVVDTFMSLNQDGTFRHGDSKAAGLGTTLEGGDNITTGRWRTQPGNILEILINGTTQWTSLARYTLQGNSLLFNCFDNSNELWNRAG